jgi:hypothetical protein
MVDKSTARELTLTCKHGPSYQKGPCMKCAQLFKVVEKAFDREIYNHYSRIGDELDGPIRQLSYPSPHWEAHVAC